MEHTGCELPSTPSHTPLAQLRPVFNPWWEGFRLSPAKPSQVTLHVQERARAVGTPVSWTPSHPVKALVDSGCVVGGGERPSLAAAKPGRPSAARTANGGSWGSTLVLPATLQTLSCVWDHGTPTMGSQHHPKPGPWDTAGKGGAGKGRTLQRGSISSFPSLTHLLGTALGWEAYPVWGLLVHKGSALGHCRPSALLKGA